MRMMLAGFALRLVVIAFMVPEHMNPILDHWNFGWEMGRVARSLYEGQGFSSPLFQNSGPTAWMAPGYPILLAGIFKIFGLFTAASAWAILILNSIFSVATILSVVAIARRFFGDRLAKIAGWTWVVFPYSVYLSAGRIWENTLTTMMMSFVLWLTLELVDKPTTAKWIGWGTLWGLGALISPAIVGVLPLLGLWVAYRHQKEGRRWLPQAATAALIFWVVLSPWVIRNYVVFNQFIPLRDNFWLEMHVGNNGDTSDVTPDSAHPSNDKSEFEQWTRLGEIGYMNAKKLETKAYIRAHPGFVAWLTVRRFVYTWTGFWSLDPKFLANEPFHIPNVLFDTSMTVLLLLGFRFAFRNGHGLDLVPLLLVLIGFPLVYYLTHPSMDYRHPIDIIIVIFGCYGVNEMVAGRRAEVPRKEEDDSVEELATS